MQIVLRYYLAVTMAILVCSCNADAPGDLAASAPITPSQLSRHDQATQNGQTMTNTKVTDVLSGNEALELLSLASVEGLGEGTCETSELIKTMTRCIIIYVSNTDAEFQSGLPTQLSGIPVRIKTSDEVSIFEAK